jgi:hypothetical protein
MLSERNEAGADVSSTGPLASFSPQGRFALEIELSSTAPITVEVQVADDEESTPITTKSYTDTTSISDVLEGVAGGAIVTITTAAADGETADYYIGAGD